MSSESEETKQTLSRQVNESVKSMESEVGEAANRKKWRERK